MKDKGNMPEIFKETWMLQELMRDMTLAGDM